MALSGLGLLARALGREAPSLEMDFAGGVYRRDRRGYALADCPGWRFTRASDARVETGGVYALVGPDAPRTAPGRGLLVEGAGVNALLHSGDLSQEAWGRNGVTVSEPETGGPMGGFRTLGCLAGGGSKWIYQSVDVVAHAHSIIAKAGGVDWIALSGGNSATGGAFVDLSSGAVGTVREGCVARTTALGDGWWRIEAVFEEPVAYLTIEPHAEDGQSPGWTAAGHETVLIAHAQAEPGARRASSPIETGAATATRAADVAQLDELTLGAPFTVVAAWSEAALEPSPSLYRLADAEGANEVAAWRETAAEGMQVRARVAGVSQATQTLAHDGEAGRLATAFGRDGYRSALNGQAATARAAGAPEVLLRRLEIGRYGAGHQLGGWIARLALAASAPTDAELEAMSA